MSRDPLAGLDLDDWIAKFRVFVSDDPDLEQYAAVHRLTYYGRIHEFGEWDVHIHRRFEEFVDVILLHEAVENWLRREGWLYKSSHAAAMDAERRFFGGTHYYDAFLRAMGEE